MPNPETRAFVIKCNSYKHRPFGEPDVPKPNKGRMYDAETGLYAGQYASPELQNQQIVDDQAAACELTEKGLCDT